MRNSKNARQFGGRFLWNIQCDQNLNLFVRTWHLRGITCCTSVNLSGQDGRNLFIFTCGAKGARGVKGGSGGSGPPYFIQNSVKTRPMIVQPTVA